MPLVSRSALVPYSPAQMFDLVDDIENYPVFLPWCTSAKVYERDRNMVKACLEMSMSGISKTFTTLNRLQHHKMIEVRLVEGPFKRLDGYWRFNSLDDGKACKVCLDMEFEFASRFVGMAVGPVFTQVANTLVSSFVQRAQQIYG